MVRSEDEEVGGNENGICVRILEASAGRRASRLRGKLGESHALIITMRRSNSG